MNGSYPALFAKALCLMVCLAAATPAVAASDPAKICAEAITRYGELYGKAPSEEPVTVVMMYKYVFCPSSVTVKVGTTVRFINIDKRTSHSVWFREEGKPESDRLFPDEKVEMTFDHPGTYPYLCGPHWETHDMLGNIVVEP